MQAQAANAREPIRRGLLLTPFLAASAASALGLLLIYTWRLEQSPPYLHADEACFGLAAHLIGSTGRDYFGHPLPTFIQCFEHGELANPVAPYWTVPFLWTLGPSVFALRLSAATVGLISIALIALTVWRLTGSRWLALAGAWILGTSPLFLIQSRILLDQIFVVPFILGWLLCLLEHERRRDDRMLVLGCVVLGVGAYSYAVARALMPLYLGMTLAVYWLSGRCRWSTMAWCVAAFALALAPMLAFATQHRDILGARFVSLTWLTLQDTTNNPAVTYAYHYLAHLDPTVLFLKGDSSVVHSTLRAGVFLKATLPLAVLGAGALVRQALAGERGFGLVLLLSAALYPAPTALLRDLRSPSRDCHILPIYTLLCVLGLQALLAGLRRLPAGRPMLAALALLFVAEAAFFVGDYHIGYPPRAAMWFFGNTPAAFRALMAEGAQQLYVSVEEGHTATVMPSYGRLYQAMYGYQGSLRYVLSSEAAQVPPDALLLTRTPAEHGEDFQRVAQIPEIATGIPPYYILRRLGSPER